MTKHTEVTPAPKDLTEVKLAVPENNKASLRWKRDRDREKVKGIFRFHELPGGRMAFFYREYKEDEVESFDMIDGEVYTIPLGVARHLNKNGWYPVHVHALDEKGRQSIKIGQKVRRFSFQSLEFVDIDDITPVGSSLITAQRDTNIY